MTYEVGFLFFVTIALCCECVNTKEVGVFIQKHNCDKTVV